MSDFKITILNKFRYALYLIYRFHKKYLQPFSHVYDLQTADIINTLPKDATCIDIGANKGQILSFIVNHCTKGHITAVEPIPELARYLRCKFKKVKVFGMALSSETTEEKTFNYIKENPAISSLASTTLIRRSVHNITKIDVRVMKFDNVFQDLKRLDFIKIDAEGSEYDIILGGKEVIKKFKPVIIFECSKELADNFNHTPENIFDLLISIGYKVSTMKNYIDNKLWYSKENFVISFNRGYDTMFIAY